MSKVPLEREIVRQDFIQTVLKYQAGVMGNTSREKLFRSFSSGLYWDFGIYDQWGITTFLGIRKDSMRRDKFVELSAKYCCADGYLKDFLQQTLLASLPVGLSCGETDDGCPNRAEYLILDNKKPGIVRASLRECVEFNREDPLVIVGNSLVKALHNEPVD